MRVKWRQGRKNCCSCSCVLSLWQSSQKSSKSRCRCMTRQSITIWEFLSLLLSFFYFSFFAIPEGASLSRALIGAYRSFLLSRSYFWSVECDGTQRRSVSLLWHTVCECVCSEALLSPKLNIPLRRYKVSERPAHPGHFHSD